MRQVAGHSTPRIDKALTAEASTCPACLDSAVLESLQWADLPAFEGLVSRSGEADEGWTLHTLSRSLVNWPTADDRTLVGLTCHGAGHRAPARLIGVAGLVPDPRNPQEAQLSILVDPLHRQQGFGGQLLDAILRIADARGYQSASARTRADNLAFMHLMVGHGFLASSHPGSEPILLHRALDSLPD